MIHGRSAYTRLGCTGLVLALAVAPARGQDDTMEAPLLEETVAFALDSGPVINNSTRRRAVYSTVVQQADAPWIRLHFERLELGHPPAGGQPTILRVTSLLDDAVQTLDREEAYRWRNSSAYFNGDAVLVEIVADPGSQPSLIVMKSFQAGLTAEGGAATICGIDDRVLSTDPRAARLVPIGCTVWLFDDANKCFLTAGHCTPGPGDVVEFNVPLSQSNGNIIHPGPEDQYLVDADSVQLQNGGVGNDWGYFGCFPNSMTALFPIEAQNDYYVIADAAPENAGQDVTIIGYGVDDSPAAWNQVQQTHTEGYNGPVGTRIFYVVDTQGGNSGSGVLDETTGLAIGIHTHGGCGGGGGENSGTAIHHPGLQSALLDPQGVCIPFPPIEITLPDGTPEFLEPAGQVIRVEVAGTEKGTPAPGTGKLHYSVDGGPAIVIDMTVVDDDVYDAVFPAFECATHVAYWFSAETTEGEVAFEPFNAPVVTYEGYAADAYDYVYIDDFETDNGWTVVNDAGLTSGEWERGIPAGFGDRGDPAMDADGSGQCWVTGIADGDNDVDGGPTTLTSPPLDATVENAHIFYRRWYSNVLGSNPNTDSMLIQVSADGLVWESLEQVGPGGPDVEGGWIAKSFRVSDFVPQTGTFRIRFIASDLGTGAIVEAGIDDLRINQSAAGVQCDPDSCPADVSGDGIVSVQDLIAVISAWGTDDAAADVNDDGTVDVQDLVGVISAWGACG